MDECNAENQNDDPVSKIKAFLTKPRLVGIFIGVVCLMTMLTIMSFFGGNAPEKDTHAVAGEQAFNATDALKQPAAEHGVAQTKTTAAEHGVVESHSSIPVSGHAVEIPTAIEPPGVAFTIASTKPLNHELRDRFWGWRPNDIINITDNVNNFQLGVLEVTRRTAVGLAERLSRTGRTAAFDTNLEQAMNWFMIKPDRYMLPSPEGKYSEGVKETLKYAERLKKGEANFYVRSDNLIPLLRDYSDLLGSCDENLAKTHEANGKPVSTFAADDYFYYSQGVASSLYTILKGISIDFEKTLESRHAMELMEHAIHSCHRAKEMDPFIVTEGDMSGYIANHRANMAAPISHARFYLDVLIMTLST